MLNIIKSLFKLKFALLKSIILFLILLLMLKFNITIALE